MSTGTSVTKATSFGKAIQINTSGGRGGVSGVVATVFGCTGLVGNHVVDLLGGVGSQVICPYRGDGYAARDLKLFGDLGQIVLVPMDITDEESVRRTLESSNVVINLLGSHDETNNFSLHDSNVKCVYRLTKMAKEAGVERFIHLSTLNASTDSSSELYKCKGESEAIVRSFFPDSTIIRSAQVYGERDKFLRRLGDMAEYYPTVPIVNGDRVIAPIHASDVAQAIFNSISIPEAVGATYEIEGPEHMTYRQLVQHMFNEIYLEYNAVEISPVFARAAFWFTGKLPRFFKLFNKDQVEQSKYDDIVHKSVSGLGIEDLGIVPYTISQKGREVFYLHRNMRSDANAGVYNREQMPTPALAENRDDADRINPTFIASNKKAYGDTL